MSDNGLNLIKKFEGFSAKAYKDPIGLWTTGFGTLIDTKEEQYLKTKLITEAEATDLLRYDVAKYEKVIEDLVTVDLNQNQFDALCVFAYNVGLGNFKSSTMLKLINKNPNNPLIKNEFGRWNKAGGKVLPGLVSRRLAESELYVKK